MLQSGTNPLKSGIGRLKVKLASPSVFLLYKTLYMYYWHTFQLKEGNSGLQDIPVATREESGVFSFPSRRGLTPRAKHIFFSHFNTSGIGLKL